MHKSNKTFWPYGIFLIIMACIVLCVYTIIVSLDYPVELDNSYFEKYQKVDADINEILAKQKEFEANYEVSFIKPDFKISKDKLLNVKVVSKNATPINLNSEVILTRPDTNKFDIKTAAKFQGENLLIDTPELPLEGRWQIMLKLFDTKVSGFYKFEFNATK
ncbi:MAG: FixH family protein [Campylobacter sp.]|nr:FixH family protein [Campylobacter sp.]